MRKRYQQEDSDANDIDMTPMLDVVFILLIFFIVTSHFVQETGIAITRPNAETASTVSDEALLISIAENGDIWLKQQPVVLDELGDRVSALHLKEPQIVLLVDKGAPSGRLIAVMDQLRLVGLQNISIAAKQTKAK